MAKPKPLRITGTDSVRYLRVSSPGQVETSTTPKGSPCPPSVRPASVVNAN